MKRSLLIKITFDQGRRRIIMGKIIIKPTVCD